jgi:hypothetical protein
MNLRMAIRAEHDAALKFSLDLLPTSVDAVNGDCKFLLAWVQVMELYRGGHAGKATCSAESAEGRDRPKFRLTAQFNHPIARGSSVMGVTDSMTVRAHEIAFRGFFDEPSETSAELSEAEFLCGWISVMELQRFRADGVATIDASSSVRCDQIEFSLLTPLSQRPTELLTPPVPARSRGLLSGSESQRNLRSVVVAERRALDAEAAPVE